MVTGDYLSIDMILELAMLSWFYWKLIRLASKAPLTAA